MSPVNVIIWSCVAIFIVTAILTLLHISGIRRLPDPNHGKVLFLALIVEVVIIAVGAFGSTLIPTEIEPSGSGISGPMTTKEGIYLDQNVIGNKDLFLPKTVQPSSESAIAQKSSNNEKSDNCYQVTVSDALTFPPTSRIETICENE